MSTPKKTRLASSVDDDESLGNAKINVKALYQSYTYIFSDTELGML
jgi:hypothetical protein